MNDENLISLKNRTTKEQREIAKKGGKKSVQVRREKKELKERLSLAVDILTDKLKTQALKNGDKALADQIEEVGADVFNLMDIATSKKVKSETRLRALSEMMDRTYGKAVQKQELMGKDGGQIESKLDINISFVG